jgi:hypothetical protein
MKLIEINPLDVQRVFPSFFHKDSKFFMIDHEGQEIGIYGVKTIHQDTCEISVCIFEEYRFKIPYRTGLKLLLSFPFTLGFGKILISTKEKSVITLLRQCKSLGVEFLEYDNNGKVWFKIERQNS